MYRVDMYYTVQTLNRQGYSKRKIAKICQRERVVQRIHHQETRFHQTHS